MPAKTNSSSPPFPSSYIPDEVDLVRSLTRECFEDFVREFWCEVPGSGNLQWNWHLTTLCEELQVVAERVFKGLPKLYDTIFNVSPGTSKSSIASILFPAWVWTRMPRARIMCASHTSELVLDLAYKSREVIRSQLYRECFPEIQLCTDKEGVSLFRNTVGGDRLSCTVGGKTPVGFHYHFALCFPWETLIHTDRGLLPVGLIVERRLPVRVLSYDHGGPGRAAGLVWGDVGAYHTNPPEPLCRVVLDDGVSLEMTEDHPVFTAGRGYVRAGSLNSNDEVFRVGPVPQLSEANQQTTQGSKEGQVRMDLLLLLLQGRLHVRPQPPALQSGGESLRSVWERVCSLSKPRSIRQVLLRLLQGGGNPPGGQLFTSQEDFEEVPGVPALDAAPAQAGGRRPEVLWHGVRGQRALCPDGRHGQFQLHSRSEWSWLHPGVSQEAQRREGEGRPRLLHLREDQRRKPQQTHGRPSHRLGQEQQRAGQPHLPVSLVSYGPPGHGCLEETPRQVPVRRVERGVRLPTAVYNLEVLGAKNYFAGGVLVHNCDDLTDPQKMLSEVEKANAASFITQIIPTRKADKVVSVAFLVMQRLGQGDPTDAMLAEARKEGGDPVRHVCIPAELTEDLSPKELAPYYVGGLMDPNRLPKSVLNGFKARSAFLYSTQFLQKRAVKGGGLFKEHYFSKRVRAAPRDCRRVFFIDRAATSEGGCATAGVLTGVDKNLNYYLEYCMWGQWEPVERNKMILAAAQRFRLKYGPHHEPVIVVEMERGSTGEEAFRSLAKLLRSFRVVEDRPTGSKDVRAEPLSDQMAAGNYYCVEDNTWDLQALIEEFLLFKPDVTVKRLGGMKDRVDASSGGFNYLNKTTPPSSFRVFRVGPRKGREPRVVVCAREELPLITVDPQHLALLVRVEDPPCPEEEEKKECELYGTPVGGPVLLEDTLPLPLSTSPPTGGEVGPGAFLDTLHLSFTDMDPKDFQGGWEERVSPYQKPPSELIMTREHGKSFWSFLLKKREPPPDVFVFCSPGGKRALTLALAFCDTLRLPRDRTLHRVSEPDYVFSGKDKPINTHVYDVAKMSRNLVV